MSTPDQFLTQLGAGPAFLFLGQSYLRLDSGRDLYLEDLRRKLAPDSEEEGYSLILDRPVFAGPAEAAAWMHDRSTRHAVPGWLDVVAQFGWSGVYTSAIDEVVLRAFRNEWRDVEPILDEDYRPADPRNPLTLHATCLFGSVARTEEAERPPLTRAELRSRRQVAVALARRLPSDVTPLGLLAIDGYSEGDWLSIDDLIPILERLGPGQVHAFGSASTLFESPDLRELIDAGIVTTHSAPLSEVLQRGFLEGRVSKGANVQDAAARRITLATAVVEVGRDVWNQVAKSAIVLDDTVLNPPTRLSTDAEYREFRRFLAGSDGTPNWAAYARGFAFERDFESEVMSLVREKLNDRAWDEVPLVVHGQTGAGKTIGLSHLALRLRQQKRAAVLFVPRRTQRPTSNHIDLFAKLVEDAGGEATIIVWDGMADPSDYSELLGFLTGRGRKVILIGSAYKLPTPRRRRTHVPVEASLSPAEVARFDAYLSAFDSTFSTKALAERFPRNEPFLAMLYRLLPATRTQIRQGVGREIGQAEDVLRRRVLERPAETYQRSVLAEALVRAGLADPAEDLAGGNVEVDGEQFSRIQQLTGLIMVPGRFGLKVPVELLIRVVGSTAFPEIAALFRGIDIFRWFEDPVGNIDIGPRTALEAQLIVDGRLGGPQTEAAFACSLIGGVRDASAGGGEDREVAFAVELLGALRGPARGGRYSPYFRDLAFALRELRELRGVRNPRLMLQEANLLREWATNSHAVLASVEVDDALNDAVDTLEVAEQLISGQGLSARRLRASILTELATTLASRARQKSDRGDLPGAIGAYRAAKETLRRARTASPGNYYPVDVLAWATRDILNSGALDSVERSEAIADVLHSFQTTASVGLEPEQMDRFDERRMSFGQLIESERLTDDAFAALIERGSRAGYYLRALGLSGLNAPRPNGSIPPQADLQAALSFLQGHRDDIASDGRCMDLLLDLFWMVHCRTRLFATPRFAPPLTLAEWRELRDIVLAAEQTGESTRPVVLAYLRGVSSFELGNVEEGVATFKEVEQASDQVRGVRRIARNLVMTDSAGRIARFHGTVNSVSWDGARGDVFVEELRRTIPFLPRDFSRSDIQRGQSLGEFQISFNFLGPLADPIVQQRPS